MNRSLREPGSIGNSSSPSESASRNSVADPFLDGTTRQETTSITLQPFNMMRLDSMNYSASLPTRSFVQAQERFFSQENRLLAAAAQTLDQASNYLPTHFSPGPNDVICARGNGAWNHPGNQKFRRFVLSYVDQYAGLCSRSDRSSLVTEIVESMFRKGATFVKRDTDPPGTWIEVSEGLVREKIGQIFRNAVGGKYKSSIHNKKRRRRDVANKLAISLHEVMKTSDPLCQAMNRMKIDLQRLTDEEVARYFDIEMPRMLHIIKGDQSLFDRFQAVEKSIVSRNAGK